MGTSGKAFVGNITGIKTPAHMIWGTATTVVANVQGLGDIVRILDAEAMNMAVKMSDAI